MTFQAFTSRLQALPQNQPIALNAALLQSNDLIGLMNTCLEVPDLAIAQPRLTIGDTQVTLIGTASVLNLTAATVRAQFTDNHGVLQLSFTVTLPADWVFSQSFPTLAPYLNFGSRGGYRRSYLNELEFADAQLVLTSAAFTAGEFRFKPGLNFAANLNLFGLLEPLGLITSAKSLIINGLITDGTKAKEFCLSAVFPFSLGTESFSFQNPTLKLYSSLAGKPIEELEGELIDAAAPEPDREITNATNLAAVTPEATLPATDATPSENAATTEAGAGEASAAASRIELSATLKIGNQPVELFTPFQLGRESFDMFILGGRTSVPLPNLGDLADLVGGANLASSLPSSLQTLGGITFSQFIAGFSLKERNLAYVMVDLTTTTPWQIVEQFTIASLNLHWLLDAPFRAAQRQMTTEIAGQLRIGTGNSAVFINLFAQTPDFMLAGQLAPGSVIKLGALLAHFIPGIPEPNDSLLVTQLDLFAQPTFKTYSITSQIENFWPIPLGFTELTIKSLFFSLDYAPNAVGVKIAGELNLLKVDFAVSAERPAGGRNWFFQGALATGQKIMLSQIVADFIDAVIGTAIVLPDSLKNIEVFDLAFSLDTGSKTAGVDDRAYFFRGAFTWDVRINEDIHFSAFAKVSIRSSPALPLTTPPGTSPALPAGSTSAALPTRTGSTRRVEGEVIGGVAFEQIVDVEFFRNLSVFITYRFHPDKTDLIFSLQKDHLFLNASFSTMTAANGQKTTLLTVDFGTSTFGDLLSFMVGIVDPGTSEFSLDPPWDELNRISLSGLKLVINLTRKEISVRYAINFNLAEVVHIQQIGLVCVKTPAGKRTVMVEIVGSILGQTHSAEQPRSWDALNEKPPVVPGQGGAIFDLSYLGIGQHVSFPPDQVAQLQNVTSVITALQLAMQPIADKTQNPLAAAGALQFNGESGWLMGAKFNVISTLDLSLIFNDPLIYGLRIGLSGPNAQIFKGLIFEILYRRISDTIGVYHVELVLPDAMRQLQFGAVAITLPVIVLDIYTNGDFKIDAGFPWRSNFARSFALDVLIFTGAGGFYFNKLSAETATSVPIITNGKFNPVIEFGIGLKVGLGRTFRKGPLLAEISITVQGIIEGIIAWFNPNNPALAKDTYYRIQGSVAIVGRLYGSVDFVVIQVEVEVIVRVAVLFVVEVHQPIYLALVAEVSVRASIKILFIRINFSFNLTVRQEFTLGSASATPWILSPDQRAVKRPGPTGTSFLPDRPQRSVFVAGHTLMLATMPTAASIATRLAEITVTRKTQPTPLSWQPIRIWQPEAAKPILQLYFQPAFTRSVVGVNGVALLVVQNTIDPNSPGPQAFVTEARAMTSDFDQLAQALLMWAIYAYHVQPLANGVPTTGDPVDIRRIPVTQSDLESIYTMFVHNQEDANESGQFNFITLSSFLQNNFTFAITSTPPATGTTSSDASTQTATPPPDLSGSLFPMFPQLALQIGPEAKITFDASDERPDVGDRRLDPAARQVLTDYFQQLKVSHGSTIDPLAPAPTRPVSGSVATATIIFEDYFALLVKSVLQEAIEYVKDLPEKSIDLVPLLDHLNNGGQFNHLAGMASRFLLHGLRLPAGPNLTMPLYQRTGQLFNLTTPTDFTLTLSKPSTLAWVTFPGENATTLPYTLPPALVRTIGDLTDTTHTPFPPQVIELTTTPDLLPLYRDVPRRFTLQHLTEWNAKVTADPAQITPILDLPDGLRDDLALKHRQTLQTNQGVDRGVSLQVKHTLPRPGIPLTEADIDWLTTYTWATKVKLNLRRLPNQDGTALLDRTYQMLGTNEADKDRLEDLWQHLRDTATTPTLYLLYPSPVATGTESGSQGSAVDQRPAGLLNQLISECFLLKTNLSTQSNAPTTTLLPALTDELYSAPLTQGKDFIQLLWQGSVTNSGGYFLRYVEQVGTELKGLPEYLFTDGMSASLTLLVMLPSQLTPPAYHFHNCLVLQEAVDLREGMLFVDTPDTTKVLTVPPGNVGFRFTRPKPTSAVTNTSGTDELLNLYQMLGYSLQQGTTLSNDGLPVGPAEADPLPLQHVIKANETLAAIADRLINQVGLSTADIALNLETKLEEIARDHADTPNLFQVGAVLPLTPDYVVVAGDTLASIARHHNQTPLEILQAMQSTANLLTVGTALRVYQDLGDLWLYERVVPLNALQARTGADATGLPSPDQNPYSTISDAATMALNFHWRDVYGNRFTAAEMSRSFPVRYFDRLLGINEWTSVVESYAFKAIDVSTVALNLELAFDQTQYVPSAERSLANAKQRTVAARDVYHRVYYQIHQPDVNFTVHTSVLSGVSHTFSATEKLRFTSFIDMAYRYLSTVATWQAHGHTVIRTDKVDDQDTLEKISNAYYFTATTGDSGVPATSAYYAPLKAIATANAETRNLFPVGTSLAIHLEHKISAPAMGTVPAVAPAVVAESLAAIAQKYGDSAIKLAQIAPANAEIPNLFQTGQTLSFATAPAPPITYKTLPGDTLTSIATATGKTPLEIVQAVQDIPNLLTPDTLLHVVYDYTTQDGDSLQLIEQKLRLIDADRNLSLVEIAFHNRTVSLNPDMQLPLEQVTATNSTAKLIIPDRVEFANPSGLPAVIFLSAPKSLADVIADMKTKLVTGLSTNRPTDLAIDANSIQFSNPDISVTVDATLRSILITVAEVAAVAIANQNILGLLTPNTLIFDANADVATLSRALSQRSSANLNQAAWRVLIAAAPAIRLNETIYTLTEQFVHLLKQAKATNPALEIAANPLVTVADVATAIAFIPNLLGANQVLVIPPIVATASITLPVKTSTYPDLLFPVTAQIDSARQITLVDADLVREVPEIQQVTAFLSPKTTTLSAAVASETEQVAALQQFAQDFAAAFSGLHLAVGNELPHKHSDQSEDADHRVTRPLWAVHLGKTGIDFDIKAPDVTNQDSNSRNDEFYPFFFTPAPIANTLLAGAVPINTYQRGRALGDSILKPVDAIDLNVLARDFLVAVEAVLEPTIAVPASKRKPDLVKQILQHKETLATAIAAQVTHILDRTIDANLTTMQKQAEQKIFAQRRDIAAESLQQQLLINLVSGYDIETIVQYNVAVNVSGITADNRQWQRQLAPRLVGQPIVVNLKQASTGKILEDIQLFNFTLSSSKIPLSQGGSYLTFFFDTKSPEKFEDIALELTYKANELEYDIKPVEGIANYQASSWLSFILPVQLPSTQSNQLPPQDMGTVDVPIPLRTYPIPPSLVLHRAEADPDSFERLQDIRQWRYTYVYEHLDMAQDAIETKVNYNLINPPSPDPAATRAAGHPLLAPLVNFSQVYPQLLPDLQLLNRDQVSPTDLETIDHAITNLEILLSTVVTQWSTWAQSLYNNPVPIVTADYEINETNVSDTNKTVTIAVNPTLPRQSFPTVIVPGYSQQLSVDADLPLPAHSITYQFVKKSPQDAALDPVFGESSIPDRILSIPDLDIIHEQNAWGAIWLTRNKGLVPHRATNPVFVYQTPQVRFNTRVTPLLVNTKRWDVATLPMGQPQTRTLAKHLELLFTTLLPNETVMPAEARHPYDIRVACRYAFALAIGESGSEDLLSTLPVLLSPRTAIAVGQDRLVATQDLRAHLVHDITDWQTTNHPVHTKAMYIFSVSFFSNLSDDTINQPLLRVDHLGLKLENIRAATL